ncbi:unnamed protein product [Caretta caretta]
MWEVLKIDMETEPVQTLGAAPAKCLRLHFWSHFHSKVQITEPVPCGRGWRRHIMGITEPAPCQSFGVRKEAGQLRTRAAAALGMRRADAGSDWLQELMGQERSSKVWEPEEAFVPQLQLEKAESLPLSTDFSEPWRDVWAHRPQFLLHYEVPKMRLQSRGDGR